jgi:RNA polymerase sigma factor (sigma-70 family)
VTIKCTVAAIDDLQGMDASAVLRPAPRRAPRVPARLLRLATDDRLVELVRAGSEPAFEAVYDRHHRGVLAFCRHMLGSPDEAEDAVQHVFLAAYRRLVGDDGRAVNLRPWLYTIARNRCLSVLRVRRERPLDEVAEPSTEHLAEEVQRREDLRTMLRDVAELPDDQRAALVLAEVGDVSHEDIAEVLGVRREKVKALVFQARSSLAASRTAREVSCSDVREQLAELRGGALRRTSLRRHLRDCAGCREFRSAVAVQRRALAVLLPVVPSAGLKAAVMGSAFGGGVAAAGGAATGAGAGSGAAGGSAAAGASGGGAALTGAASSVGGAGLAAKALVVVAVAGSGAAVGTRELTASHPPAAAHHVAPVRDAYRARPRTHAVPATRSAAAEPRTPAAAAGGRAKTSTGASAIAHADGHRARGHHAADSDGNHGLGDGSGGGRSQAPGQLAKGGGSGNGAAGRGNAGPGGGTATAPGRLKAPSANARGGNSAGHRTTPPAAGGPTTTRGSAKGTTTPANAGTRPGGALGVVKKPPPARTPPVIPTPQASVAPAATPAALPPSAKPHGGPKAG